MDWTHDQDADAKTLAGFSDDSVKCSADSEEISSPPETEKSADNSTKTTARENDTRGFFQRVSVFLQGFSILKRYPADSRRRIENRETATTDCYVDCVWSDKGRAPGAAGRLELRGWRRGIEIAVSTMVNYGLSREDIVSAATRATAGLVPEADVKEVVEAAVTVEMARKLAREGRPELRDAWMVARMAARILSNWGYSREDIAEAATRAVAGFVPEADGKEVVEAAVVAEMARKIALRGAREAAGCAVRIMAKGGFSREHMVSAATLAVAGMLPEADVKEVVETTVAAEMACKLAREGPV